MAFWKFPIALLGFAVLSAPAFADHVDHSLATAKRLAADCKDDVPALRAMCIGYLAAIADGIARHQQMGVVNRTVCVPTDVTVEAFRGAFLQYMATNPKAIEEHSFEAVLAALQAKWPCSR